ncbi:hypothetical protein LguiA_012160 [Lonicera macranthoides]
MVLSFCSGVSASTAHTWTTLSESGANDVRVLYIKTRRHKWSKWNYQHLVLAHQSPANSLAAIKECNVVGFATNSASLATITSIRSPCRIQMGAL